MEIGRSNYRARLSELLSSIETADFIGLDTEFTGFHRDFDSRYNRYDTLEERYRKLKLNVNEFWVCQLGFCTFKFSEERGVYSARPYNVNLLPYSRNRRTGIAYSNMQFLVRCGCDLNRVFTEGIECTRLGELTANLAESVQLWSHTQFSQGTSDLLEGYEEELKDFLKKPQKSLCLCPPNSYIKKLLLARNGILNKFKNLNINCTDTGKINIKKNKKKPPVFVQEEQKENDSETEDQKLERVLGFTMVFAALLKCKKPIVGHNFFLDLAFLYNHFIGELPQSFAQYKSTVLATFPALYDTKLLAERLRKSHVIDQTDLAGLFKLCSTKEKLALDYQICLSERFSSYQSEGKAHEAGYDAYMTGVIYLHLTKYLLRTEEFSSLQELEAYYKNKICVVSHAKRFFDFNDIEEADLIPENLIKLYTTETKSIQLVASEMAAFGDTTIVQIKPNAFYAKFEYVTHDLTMNALIESINEQGVYRASPYN